MLVTAPQIHVLAIIASLESIKSLPAEETGFGPVAFAFHNLTSDCSLEEAPIL